MSEQKAFLEKFHIKNFLSLRNVTLPLKPLTVLVGPNASGKSNILSALRLLNWMILVEELPPTEAIQDLFWAGKANHITFQLQAKVERTPAVYKLDLKEATNNLLVDEELRVKDVNIISTQNGQGKVQDEDSKNETTYNSNKLALRSAGDYGNKPVTSVLTEFIKGWYFYNFQPERIRHLLAGLETQVVFGTPKGLQESPKLDVEGSTLSALLSYWHDRERTRFDKVSESLATCTNIRIDQRLINGRKHLYLLEGYRKPIPMERASDGTLRLIAYYILLNEPELPPLIAIEEPERNLHPGALTDIANVLERLAQRTQVIITTHSSQLLDAFGPESLSDSLSILLLRNRTGLGTEVLNLEEIRDKQEALKGWITDFGIGSAIFDSELLQDLMEEPVC